MLLIGLIVWGIASVVDDIFNGLDFIGFLLTAVGALRLLIKYKEDTQ